MSNNLARYDNNGIEILIDTQTGESFASVSGYARMSGKSKSTISERLNKVFDDNCNKSVEILTPGGIQGVRLISEDLICEWLPKDNPEMSAQILKLGVRLFLHKLSGFAIAPMHTNSKLDDLEITSRAIDFIERLGLKPRRSRATFIKFCKFYKNLCPFVK